MTSLCHWLLLLLLTGVGAGPTSCPHEEGDLAHGQTKQTSDCKKLRCNNGLLTTQYCRRVPPRCTVVEEDLSRPYPDCCPLLSCGKGSNVGSDGRRVIPGVPRGGSATCTHNGRTIANGQSVQGPNCRRFDCEGGLVTTQFCGAVPAGCNVVTRDVGKPYPECCPKWYCDG